MPHKWIAIMSQETIVVFAKQHVCYANLPKLLVALIHQISSLKKTTKKIPLQFVKHLKRTKHIMSFLAEWMLNIKLKWCKNELKKKKVQYYPCGIPKLQHCENIAHILMELPQLLNISLLHILLSSFHCSWSFFFTRTNRKWCRSETRKNFKFRAFTVVFGTIIV